MTIGRIRRLSTAALCTALLTLGCSKDKSTGPDPVEQLLVVAGNEQTAWANTALPQPLTVQVVTKSGKGAANVSVVFEVLTPWRGDSTWADTVTTDASGQAATVFTLDYETGTDTVRAGIADSTVAPVFFTVIGTPYWSGSPPPFALAPPPPGQGIQMVIGPFYVEPGTEVQRNYYVKFPSDEDLDFNRVEFAYSPGSHHFNIYRNRTQNLPDSVFNSFIGIFWVPPWELVINSQQNRLELTFPTGVAMRMKAHEQLNVQSHYVNAQTQNTPDNYGLIYVNFWKADPGFVKSYVGRFVAFNNTILLPPHQESEFTYEFAMNNPEFGSVPFPINVLGMTGHFHSRGKRFTVTHFPLQQGGGWGGGWGGGGDGDTNGVEVYRSETWSVPPFVAYDNPFSVSNLDIFEFTTTYFNETDAEIKFGGHVETEEHANLFVYFYPSSTPEGDYINVGGHPK